MSTPRLLVELCALSAMAAALTAFAALNFTGASTYTSLSGVTKEMKVAFPAQIATGAAGVVAWIAARFL